MKLLERRSKTKTVTIDETEIVLHMPSAGVRLDFCETADESVKAFESGMNTFGAMRIDLKAQMVLILGCVLPGFKREEHVDVRKQLESEEASFIEELFKACADFSGLSEEGENGKKPEEPQT